MNKILNSDDLINNPAVNPSFLPPVSRDIDFKTSTPISLPKKDNASVEDVTMETLSSSVEKELTGYLQETPINNIETELEGYLAGNSDDAPFKMNIIKSNDKDPVKWGTATKIARELEVNDVENVYANFPAYEEKWKLQTREKLIKQNPAIVQMMKDDPNLANQIDTATGEGLKRIYDTFTVYGKYNEPSKLNPLNAMKEINYVYKTAGERLSEYANFYDLMGREGGKDKIRKINKNLQSGPSVDYSGWMPTDLILAAADQIPYMEKTALPVLIGAVSGAPLGPIGAAVGAGSGLTYAGYQSFKIETGSMYADLIDTFDENGTGLDDETMVGASLVYGSLAAGIELLPVKKFLNTIPGFKMFSATIAKKQIKDYLKDKTKRDMFKEIGKDYLISVGFEAGQESLQEGVSVAVKRFAKYDANQNGANFKQNPLTDDFLSIVDAGLMAAKASIAISGATTGTRAFTENKRFNELAEINMLNRGKELKALTDIQILDKIQTVSANLNTDPTATRQFFQTASRGSLIEDVFLSVADTEKILADVVIKDNERLKQSGFLDQINHELAEAKKAGTAVRIAYSNFATAIKGDMATYKAFRPYIKTYEEGMTIAEVEASRERKKQIIEEGKQIANKNKADYDYAYGVFLKAMSEGDMPPVQKKAVAEMNARCALVYAKETGLSVEQVLFEAGISYAREYKGATIAKSDMQKIIDAARMNAKTHESQNLLEASKEVGKADINAIKKSLSALIQNPSEGDAKNYLKLLNMLSDLKADITRMSNDEVMSAWENNKVKIPDFKIDIKREESDKQKSGMFSKSETALANVQDAESDYVAIGGGRIPIRYEVVELDDIITSDKENYPAAYQPRDRSRISSEAQINEIAAKFTPERVGKNVVGSEGAPIITKDGKNVLVGNGRSMAIRKLYDEKKGDIYKNYLIKEGFDISNLKNPVLVRRLNVDLDENETQALIDAANTSATMTYSASKNALRDAAKMTSNLLEGLDPDAAIDSAANRMFAKSFFNDVIPSAERNALLDKDNRVTARGIERIENALVAMILPDARFLSNLLENPDNNIRKATSFLAKSAPAIIYLENEIASGRLPATYSIINNVAKAVHILKRAKDKNMELKIYLKQMDMLEDPVELASKSIIYMFDTLGSPKDFAQKINDYVQSAISEGDTRQDNMLGLQPRSKDEILAAITGLKDIVAANKEFYQPPAMYASPIKNIKAFVEDVIINPDKNKRFIRINLNNVDVDIPSDTILHDKNKHGLNAKDWEIIFNNFNNIEDARLSFKQGFYGIPVLIKLKINNNKYGLVIEHNESGRNIITTAFKDNAWMNKEHQEPSSHPTASESRTPSVAHLGNSLNDIVTNLDNFVNEQPASTDTPEFKKWFGNSKIVDEQGKPLVVYHGTGSVFNTFDKEKIRTVTDQGFYGAGFYFTSGKGEAGYYGENIMPVYLKAENPIDITEVLGGYYFGLKDNHFEKGGEMLKNLGLLSVEDENQLALYKKNKDDFFKKAKVEKSYTTDKDGKKIDFLIASIDVDGQTRIEWSYDANKYSGKQEELSTPENALNRLWNRYFRDNEDLIKNFSLPDYIRENGLAEKMTETVKSLGYDGIISGDEYVVFEPNQIKSINNRGSFGKTGNIFYQPGFAGSRVDYDRPSLEKLGTGEGQQVHGWGLYYALKKDVAERYRETFERESKKITYKGKEIKGLLSVEDENQLALYKKNKDDFFNGMLQEAKDEQDINYTKKLIDAFEKLDKSKVEVKKAKGQVHEVDLPENGFLLDEQKPFSEQSDFVKEELEKINKDGKAKGFLDTLRTYNADNGIIGYDIYHKISDYAGGDKEASQLLEEHGIKGITYYGRRDGRAFVIFNPDDVKVINKFYQQIANNDGKVFGKAVYARGSYQPDTRLITLFETANLTTIIHEHGHHWLAMMQHFAGKDTASDRLKNDWKIMSEWLGVGEDGIITTKMHEKAARAFETYFMVAEAPTFSLRGVFTAFKRWLLSEYKTADALGIDMPDEIRSVFDRMLATDAEISEYYSARGLNQMFKSAEEAGMSDAEFAKYEDMFRQSVIDSSNVRAIQQAAMIKKEQSSEFLNKKDEIRQHLLDEWAQNKFVRALFAILQGKIGDTTIDITINETELRDAFSGKDITVLPRKVNGKRIYAEDGMNIELAAELLGITSKQLKEIIFNSRRTMRLFEEDLNTRAHDELGDEVLLKDIEAEQISIANTSARKEFLLSELSNLLTRSKSKAQIVAKTLQTFAEETIGKKAIRDILPNIYFSNFTQAGEMAAACLMEGKLDLAARHKEKQIRNYYLYIEAKKVLENIDKRVHRLKQIGKKEVNPNVEQTHWDAARVLLGKVSLAGKLGQKAKERMGNIAVWVAKMRDDGYEIEIPENYLMDMEQKPYTYLTAHDFIALDDSITNIIHNGRQIKNIDVGEQTKDRDKVITEIEKQLSTRFKKIKTTPSSRKPLDIRAVNALRSLDAMLTTLGGLANRLDGADTRGLFHKIFVKPLTNAQTLENNLILKYTQKLYELMQSLPKATRKRMRKYDRQIADKFKNKYTTLEDVISIALNMGNDFNLQRLKEGNGITDEQLDYVKGLLNKAEWDFIQNVWDLLDSMYPMLEEHHKKLSGLDMDKVFPIPIRTAFGEYKGGYYPIVYDYEHSASMSAKREERNEGALFDNDYGRPTTSKGYTKKRNETVAEPLKMGLSVVGNHINTVLHDVAYRKVLRQLWSFANGADFIALFDAYVGKEYREMLNGLLRSIANMPNQEMRDISAIEKVFRFIRRRTTLIGLGFRLSTIMTQPLGLANSIAKITEAKRKLGGSHGGTYWTMIGLKKLLNDDARKWALDASGELRARLGNNDASVMLRIKELRGKNNFVSSAEAWSYKAMGYMDYFTAMATWLGAYEQAIVDLKMSPDDAVFSADRTMLNSQGSGNLKDTITLQRKGEVLKMFTLFYSFFASLYQMSGQLARDAYNMKNMDDFMNVSARFISMYIVASIAGRLLQGDTPDDDGSIIWWLIETPVSYLLSALPFVRDLTALKYGSAGKTPYGRQADSAYYWVKEISKALDGDLRFRQMVKKTLDVGGFATGLPIGGQIATTISYFAGLSAGEYKADSLADILWGIYKGKEQKD